MEFELCMCFLGGIYTFSFCLCGLYLVTLDSSHSPQTCMLGQLETLNCPSCECVCVCVGLFLPSILTTGMDSYDNKVHSIFQFTTKWSNS